MPAPSVPVWKTPANNSTHDASVLLSWEPSTVSAEPPPAGTAPTGVAITSHADNGTVTAGQQFTISGTQTGGTSGVLYDGATNLGAVTLGSGTWSTAITLAAGSHAVRVEITNANGTTVSAIIDLTAVSGVSFATDFEGGTPVEGDPMPGWDEPWGGPTEPEYTTDGGVGWALRYRTQTQAHRAQRWIVPGDIADGQVLVRIATLDDPGPSGSKTIYGICVRGAGTDTNPTGVGAFLTQLSDGSRVFHITSTGLGANPLPYGWIHGTHYWGRLDFRGTALKVKIWERGTPEPAPWLYENANGIAVGLATGFVGLRGYSPSNSRCFYYAVSTAVGDIPVPE